MPGTLNLLQCDFRFGLKPDLVGNARFLPPLAVLSPDLWQVQAERYGHARFLGGHRKADRHPAVILFAHLTAILSSHAHRFVTFFREPGVIHHPRYYRLSTEHGRQHKIQTPVQDGLITPRGVGHHMMQRLMHASHPIRSQSRGHRLDALDICRKAFSLWAWRGLFAHETILH